VLSRYGALNGRELETMTHGESPWRLANASRRPGDRAPVRQEWITEHFRTDGAPDDGLDDVPLDSDAVSLWLRESAESARDKKDTIDDVDRLRSWATGGS
jgi:hypothetical protein